MVGLSASTSRALGLIRVDATDSRRSRRMLSFGFDDSVDFVSAKSVASTRTAGFLSETERFRTND